MDHTARQRRHPRRQWLVGCVLPVALATGPQLTAAKQRLDTDLPALAVASKPSPAAPVAQSAAFPADLGPEAEALRDIKPLRPAKAGVWPYVLAAAAAVVCLGLCLWAWWARRARRRAAASTQKPQRPPHEIALAALQALHRVNFADEAAVRQYYFDISEVLRAYVTARFDVSASQSTTEEIFSRLPKIVALAPPENLRLRAFLAQTDQVKYALHQATPEEIGATYAQAAAFIEATRLQPASHGPDASGPGASSAKEAQ